MKHFGVKFVIIGILSLFLLSRTPVANVSTHLEGTSFDTVPITNFRLISTPTKSEIKIPKQRVSRPKTQKSQNKTQFTSKTAKSTVSSSVTLKTAQKTSVQVNSISIAGSTIPVFIATPDEYGYLPDAGDKVGFYNDHFFYGHNTSKVFEKLKNLSVGSVFTVTLNGYTTTYQVRIKETLKKAGTLDSKTAESRETLAKIYNATYKGNFDVSLMTCAGTNYGNGDASHRLVIMASRV